MAKFKLKLKITGFEMEIEGSRDDIPLMNQAIGQQFSGLLQPMSDVVEGEAKVINDKPSLVVPVPEESKKKRRKRSTGSKEANSNSDQVKQHPDAPIEFSHKREMHGYPLQSWNTTDKCIWLIYVLSQETNQTEFTARQLADTFNKYFKDAKMIEVSNINRDLARAKGRDNAKVSSDTKKEPTTWFLTQKGIETAQKIITGK